MSSRSLPQFLHQIKFDPETKEVSCTCPSYRYKGYCSHIKFYKDAYGKKEGGVDRSSTDQP